jgi:hypothetical protein
MPEGGVRRPEATWLRVVVFWPPAVVKACTAGSISFMLLRLSSELCEDFFCFLKIL